MINTDSETDNQVSPPVKELSLAHPNMALKQKGCCSWACFLCYASSSSYTTRLFDTIPTVQTTEV